MSKENLFHSDHGAGWDPGFDYDPLAIRKPPEKKKPCPECGEEKRLAHGLVCRGKRKRDG